MDRASMIQGIFPEAEKIPPEFRLPSPVAVTEYLINGELIPWNGPREEVYSPVCVSGGNGPSRQLIGAFPLMSDKKALEALDAGGQPTTAAGGMADHGGEGPDRLHSDLRL